MIATKCQQDELYRAEETLPQQGRLFHSITEIQQFVDGLRDELWWNTLGYWAVPRIEVGIKPARSSGSVGWWDASKQGGRIEMLRVHWTELIVLHEVAHVLAEAIHGSHAHDPWFARIYTNLVYGVMGSEVWQQLVTAFDAHGIKYLQAGAS